MKPPLLVAPYICLTDAIPPLRTAGQAIYTEDRWEGGVNTGRHCVAQVFDETCREWDEFGCAKAARLLPDAVLANGYAELFAASPKMAELLIRLIDPDPSGHDEAKRAARTVLASIGFNMVSD